MCDIFGIKKLPATVVHFEPYLMTCGQKIPTVKKGDIFKYLGKSFKFEIDFIIYTRFFL